MAQTSDVTIRLLTLGGQWETAGHDRFPRAIPESVAYVTNEWGPETCSFVLKRDPGDFHPDLTAFTPCEIEIGGVVVWKGRVKEAPSREGGDAQIAVAGEGMQFHLDDDLYQRVYTHTRLADYVDMRTMPTATLGSGQLNAAGQVSADTGSIQLGWPKDAVLPAGAAVGVVLDLGPNSKATSFGLDWESSNNFGAASLFVRSSNFPDNQNGWITINYSDGLVLANNSAASGTNYQGGFTTPRRYVQVFMYTTAGGTIGADVFFKIKGMRVFTDTLWDGYGISVLRASTVVQDALSKATKQISIPNIAPLSYRNEVMSTNGIAQALPLDETGGGTTADLVDTTRTYSINFPGTTLGAPGLLQDEPSDKSMTFNGTNSSYVQGPVVVAKTADWGFEVVFKTTTLPQTIGTILHNGNGLSGWGLGISDGAGNAGSRLHLLFGSVGWVNTNFTLVSGTTYHVVVTRTILGTVQVWVNKNLAYSGSPTGPTTPSGNLYLGTYQVGGGPGAVTISWAAVYSRAIGGGEIGAHYDAALNRGTGGTIQRTDFDIPEFRAGDSSSPQTAREVITAANALHDYQTRVEEDDTFIFRPKPSAPLLEVGKWAGSAFEDTSAGSAPEIYSRCIVTGTGADGLPIWVDNDGMSVLSGAQFTNPSFDVNTSDWSITVGTGTRDTGVFHSTPASLRMNSAAGGGSAAFVGSPTHITGIPLVPDRNYVLKFWVMIPSGTQLDTQGTGVSGQTYATLLISSSSALSPPLLHFLGEGTASGTVFNGDGVWRQYSYPFVMRAGGPSPGVVQFGVVLKNTNATAGQINGYLDDVQVFERDPRLITTRRGITRTKSLSLQTITTSSVATQIGQIFLNGHSTTPTKGSLKVVGGQGIRTVVGGANVPAHALGPYTGELVRLSHIVDPDTGGLGRDGRIAAVAYDHSTRTASLSIDNQRQNFEALLSRLAVVTSSATQT